MPDFHIWSFLTGILAGGLLTRVGTFIADWFSGKGAELVGEKLNAFGEKLNQNALLGQIQADDAVIKILEKAVPDVMAELAENLRTDLKDGKLDAQNWENIAQELWKKAEPQIKGGAMDYLKHSSFGDGKVIAAEVFKRMVNKKKAEAAGLPS